MDQFLTNGNKAVPKLIMIDDKSCEAINTFGPRPNALTEKVIAYKAEHGKITSEFKEDIQKWYNKDKGQEIITELSELL